MKTLSDSPVSFFDTAADRFVELYRSKAGFGDRLALFTAAVARVVPVPGKILDFGCGPGVISLALARMGHEVLAVDGAPTMVEVARVRAESSGLQTRMKFAVMDAADMSLESNAFDCVVCSSVLEYIDDDSRLVADLVKAVRPGGYLIISVPQAVSIVSVITEVFRPLVYLFRSKQRTDLFRRRKYASDRLFRLLDAAGLTGFSRTYFEAPIPGRLGVALSRSRLIGAMLLVIGCKPGGGRLPGAVSAASTA
jgi:ubiquinone/menaquinone biosynthesis C-methylase UbiE